MRTVTRGEVLRTATIQMVAEATRRRVAEAVRRRVADGNKAKGCGRLKGRRVANGVAKVAEGKNLPRTFQLFPKIRETVRIWRIWKNKSADLDKGADLADLDAKVRIWRI